MLMFRQIRRKRAARRSIRENVVVGSDFSVGIGSTLWAPNSLTIGDHVALGSHVRIEVDGEIGDHVLIANAAAIVGRADHDMSEIGKTIREARWIGDFPTMSPPTNIGSDVWIGFGAIVLSGVSIGDSAIVGAGSVVTADVPSNSIAVGNPARVIKTRYSPENLQTHWRILMRRGIFPRTLEIEPDQ